ncbi:MAG: hypothetical protein ACLQVX_22040 [Limisphaerales bacterium]
MPNIDLKAVKTTFDRAVRTERFSERSPFEQTALLREWEPVALLNVKLLETLTPAQVETVQRRMTRAVYFIELVKSDVTSTKCDVRWAARFPARDPRKASFDDCVAIHENLCRSIIASLGDPEFQNEMKLVVTWGLSPHEFPVDYASKDAVPIHSLGNLRLARDPGHLRLLKVRQALLDSKLNADFQLFASILEKVRVKSYLTDRALTGDFKTNREKRWEAHPQSPQFALRRDCLAVELELIDQLVRHTKFPAGTIRYLQSVGLFGDTSKVARCPVTLDVLDFELLAQEVADPTHGKSAYQVGHLNPLKAGDSAEFRHTCANISWITEDGNRIQGSLTLRETRELLLRISRNYDALIKARDITP